MKRVYITLIAIITLATAIAQLQNRLPASVQMFLLENPISEQDASRANLIYEELRKYGVIEDFLVAFYRQMFYRQKRHLTYCR